jgi:glutathione synthase/RimK-type ligase-like ATP-grasp enzyme
MKRGISITPPRGWLLLLEGTSNGSRALRHRPRDRSPTYAERVIERLGWVTTQEARGRDEDQPVGLAALTRTGVSVEVVDWDDQAVDWSRFDRVVLRSAWDYPQRLDEFSIWLDAVDAVTDLVNPPGLVRWSLDKQYLAELAEAGVPITPTVFVPPGSPTTFPPGRVVVKPAVGAGSVDAASYGADQHDEATSHVSRLHAAGQVVLVQPFLRSIPEEGEWPMVFLDGRFSHAANKRVALPQAGSVDDLFAPETNAAHVASPAQIEVAQAAVDLVCDRFEVPTYARVDLVRDDTGGFCVLELELVEPSLFLAYAEPAATERFAAVLAR